MSEIIVIGGNHHNTLGVIRSLGFKGLTPIVILVTDENKPYVAYSRFIKKLITINSSDGIIGVLKELAYSLEQKSVIVACSDGASSMLDLHRKELEENYYIPGCKDQGRLTKYMDKEVMSELGREIGFNVPETWIVETQSDIDQCEYPCISKPILSKDGKKSDIRICRNHIDLQELINDGCCYKYQVQRFVEKSFEYQLIGLAVGGANLIIPGVSRCIRPCPGTNTGFLRYELLDGIDAPLDKCKEFVKKIGYEGLFSIEFLRGRDGKDYFMEMNFRNDGNSICVTKAGYNLPYLWYLYCIGEDYKKEFSMCKLKPVLVMPEFDDHGFVSRGEISFWQWLKDIVRSDAYMEFDSKDMKPFFVRLRDTFEKKLYKMVYKS